MWSVWGMKLLAAWVGIALCSMMAAMAESSATPDQVFLEVNKDLPKYKSLDYNYELKEGVEPFLVKAWFHDGIFRRLKASQKLKGDVLTRDFYYNEDGDLRFALVTLAPEAKGEKPSVPVEERFDFVDGELVRYIGPDKKPVAKEDKNFTEMETSLTKMSVDVMERIEGSTAYADMTEGANAGPKVPAGTVLGAGFSDGVFSAVEEGDYFHLDLEQADGEIMTFFVITKDKSVDPFLNDSLKEKGKKIRVHWTEKMQEIPEAGGVIRVKVCDRIEILQ